MDKNLFSMFLDEVTSSITTTQTTLQTSTKEQGKLGDKRLQNLLYA